MLLDILTPFRKHSRTSSDVMSNCDQDACDEDEVVALRHPDDDEQEDEDEKSSMLSHPSSSSPSSSTIEERNERILEFIKTYQCPDESGAVGHCGPIHREQYSTHIYGGTLGRSDELDGYVDGETSAMYTISREDMTPPSHTKALDTVLEITKQAQLIAQSIGQAFQVAYMEFLKANGIEDTGLMKEIDYQEVLNQQEIYGEELYLFSNKEMQKEVIVPKLKGEALGIVVVESGWGSMVPTVVLANMNPTGAAARCGQLNIGDQIMSVNGVSLVGLPLSSCQNYIKAVRNQTVVKLNVVSCPPVVEVVIKRPDVKYQLGFSVQNGVICSLLRGGIAERGGVRVGHRIIEINGQSVVAVAHEKIVSMLASSVGEITMKTMPTSIFRLLTGQDTPHYI